MSFQLHFRYTICIELDFNRRGLLAFCEGFSLGSLLNQSRTYQGNPCGVYPDLSSLSGSGVIQTLWHVSSNPLLIRIASSDIKALALDTGSILSNFYFFLCNLSQVRVLFYNLHSCLCVWLLSCLCLVCILVLFLFFCCFTLVLASFCFKFCLGTILLAGWIWGLGFRRSNCLIAYWMNCLNYPRWIWKESIIKKSCRKFEKNGCLIFERRFKVVRGVFFG